MRPMLLLLVALALSAGTALAQYAAPGTTTSATTVTTATTIAGTTVLCPSDLPAPSLCPAIAASTLTGDTMIRILGSEEYYALDNLNARHLGWRDAPSNYSSQFSQGNPLTYHNPNPAVTRHGNPYYPYYQLSTPMRLALRAPRFAMTFPGSLSTADRETLTAVANRYRGLTPQQAVAMGYQSTNTCLPGVGIAYVNPSLISTTIDPLQPQAFGFSPDGRLLAVHYIVQSNQPVMAFGQSFQPSPLVANAQQLPVWLYEANSAGMFALNNSRVSCATTVTSAVSTTTRAAY